MLSKQAIPYFDGNPMIHLSDRCQWVKSSDKIHGATLHNTRKEVSYIAR